MNASSNLHEVLCFLFQVRQFKVQTVPLHGRFARPVSGPSQCASTHPSAAALPTPTAFHSSPAEREKEDWCLSVERGSEGEAITREVPYFGRRICSRGERRGVSSQFHSGPPLLPLTQSSSPFLSVPLLSPLTVGQMQQGFFNSFFSNPNLGNKHVEYGCGAYLDFKNLQVLGFHCTFLLPMKLHQIKS